ncbi:MAG: bifunctional DNA primase/polymerase [Dolichospermum sp. DET73]|nr:bifunctional DNA primase/polymerase [Dolichospermum sp. DET73]
MTNPKIPEWQRLNRISNTQQEVVNELEIIPPQWSLTPLADKQPLRKSWQEEKKLSHGEISDFILSNSFCSGFGLRTGDYSDGLIAIDVDGSSAQPLLDLISGGDIPETVKWTSGKKGRYQILFQIPSEFRENLAGFSRKAIKEWEGLEANNGEQLEFRYNRVQSALPPSRHPDTGSYKWLNSPQDVEVAIAPDWLINLVISFASKDNVKGKERKERNNTVNREAKGFGSGIVTDLVSFLKYEVLPRLSPEQIYNWPGHNFQDFGQTLKGNPPWRESASGTSFHVWNDGEQWAWQDKSTGDGGGAVQYRWKLKGGYGTPKGKDYVSIVEELANDAGLTLPSFKGKNKEKAKSEDKKNKDKDKDNLEVDNAQLNTEIFLYKKATSLDFEKLEELGIKVKRINTKLLTPDDLNLEKGKITFVISPKGTGKTKASGEALKNYDALYSWHHRISLGRSIQKTLEVTYFDDLHKARNKHRVSFCAQRSQQLNPGNLRENGALFIDECDQVLDFIFSLLCNSNNNRPLILNALHEQLQAAVFGGVALFMSADIAMKEVMLIHSLALPGTPIEIVINEYQPEQGIVNFSNDKKPDGLAAKLIELLRDKKPCFVVDDFKNSYRGGKTLAEILQAEVTDIKLQIIHAENSGSVEVRQFLDNVNVESLETDVIVVSPSVISGLSIENGRFKHCFAFVNGILSDSQVLQAINRPRGCENFYIWAADKGLGTEAGGAITPEEVHNFYRRNYEVRNAHFLSYGNRYDVIEDEWKSPFFTLYCENVALDNLIKRRLNFWIKDRLVGEGYAVVDCEFGDNKDLVKEQKIAWKKISIAEAVVIGNAKLNNEDEQKKLSAKIEAGISLLPEELASFRKTHIHETFGEDFIKACVQEVEVNKETLESAILTDYAAVAYQNQNGKLEQGLRRYYKFFKRPIEDCIETDKKRDTNQRDSSFYGFLFPGDIRWTTREHKFWEGIGFREYLQPERRWQGWELAQIIAKIQPNLQQTKDCIGIDFSRGDLQKYYSKGFGELCKRLGLQTESEQSSDGDRSRSYYITSESLKMAEMFASHQEHRRLLREENKSEQMSGLYSNSVSFSDICSAETPTAQHFQQQPDFNTLTSPQAQKLATLEVCSEEIHPLLTIGDAHQLKEDCISEVNSADELRDWIKRHSLTLDSFKENIQSKIKSPNLINDFDDWVKVLAI